MTYDHKRKGLRHVTSARPPAEDEILLIDGQSLTIEDVIEVARHGRVAKLAPLALSNMEASRRMVEGIVASRRTIYGVTTGFGDLSMTHIPDMDIYRLQQNLVRSHAVGVGPCFPVDVVRAIMLLQANKLCIGHSGVSWTLPQLLLDCLAAGVHPLVPSQGSVGASGDLAPLAHIALVLIGEGKAEVEGEILSGKDALARRGLCPLTLGPKEGLALLNGTEVSTAVATLAVNDATILLDATIVAGSYQRGGASGEWSPLC